MSRSGSNRPGRLFHVPLDKELAICFHLYMNTHSNTPTSPFNFEVRDNRVVVIRNQNRPVLVSPILHINTVNAIFAGISGIETDEVQALSEHLHADTDESGYGVWSVVTDLDETEIKMIRKALKGNPELRKFNRAIKEEQAA